MTPPLCRNIPASLDPYFYDDARQACSQLQASNPAPSRQTTYWDYFADPSDRIPFYQRLVAGAALPIAGPLALFGSLTGCNRPSNQPTPPSIPVPEKLNFDGRQVELPAGLFQIEEDLAGDPTLGHVLFVRDFHAPPGFSEMTPRAQGPVWRYQWSLLGLFERLRPRHVFVEELSRNGSTPLVLERLAEAGPIEASLPNIQELRSVTSVFETRPSPALSYFAGAVGADSLHALRYVNEVTLHRTLSPEEALQSERGLQNSTDCLSDAGAENCSQVFEENSLRDREAWASREVIQYLRQNPGASVVLVFGGRHQFCDNFMRENFRPRMTTLEVKMDALGYSRLAPPTAQHCR